MSILSIASNLLSETGLSSLVSSALSPQYSITVKSQDTNNPIDVDVDDTPFEPSSWVSFEHIAESTISTAPIEAGSYSSFNKVQRPAEIRITFTVEGWFGMDGNIPNPYTSASHTRTEMLNLLEDMKKYAYTYNIETPDKVYSGYDLIHFDYQTRSNNGVTLLVVNAFFQEVRETMEAKLSGGSLSATVNLTNLSTDTSAMSSVLGNVSDASGTASSGLSSLSEKVSGIVEQTSNTVSSAMSTVTTNIQSAVSTVSSVYSKVDSAIPAQAKTAAYSIYNSLR